MYMFQSNLLGTTDGLPAGGNSDQFTSGGGPAFINNAFQGNEAVVHEANDSAGTFTSSNATLDATFPVSRGAGTSRGCTGTAARRRASRCTSGTTGRGFDSMDVGSFQVFPGGATVAPGSNQFKLQFLACMPPAEQFRLVRVGAAAQDLVAPTGKVDPDDLGLERFITATRRQNFLVPPRRHRAVPLLELT
jgi:hypothetical protein